MPEAQLMSTGQALTILVLAIAFLVVLTADLKYDNRDEEDV